MLAEKYFKDICDLQEFLSRHYISENESYPNCSDRINIFKAEFCKLATEESAKLRYIYRTKSGDFAIIDGKAYQEKHPCHFFEAGTNYEIHMLTIKILNFSKLLLAVTALDLYVNNDSEEYGKLLDPKEKSDQVLTLELANFLKELEIDKMIMSDDKSPMIMEAKKLITIFLNKCIANGHKEAIEALFKLERNYKIKGIEPKSPENEAKYQGTPLHFALLQKREDILDLVIKNSHKIHLEKDLYNRDILQIAIEEDFDREPEEKALNRVDKLLKEKSLARHLFTGGQAISALQAQEYFRKTYINYLDEPKNKRHSEINAKLENFIKTETEKMMLEKTLDEVRRPKKTSVWEFKKKYTTSSSPFPVAVSKLPQRPTSKLK